MNSSGNTGYCCSCGYSDRIMMNRRDSHSSNVKSPISQAEEKCTTGFDERADPTNASQIEQVSPYMIPIFQFVPMNQVNFESNSFISNTCVASSVNTLHSEANIDDKHKKSSEESAKYTNCIEIIAGALNMANTIVNDVLNKKEVNKDALENSVFALKMATFMMKGMLKFNGNPDFDFFNINAKHTCEKTEQESVKNVGEKSEPVEELSTSLDSVEDIGDRKDCVKGKEADVGEKSEKGEDTSLDLVKDDGKDSIKVKEAAVDKKDEQVEEFSTLDPVDANGNRKGSVKVSFPNCKSVQDCVLPLPKGFFKEEFAAGTNANENNEYDVDFLEANEEFQEVNNEKYADAPGNFISKMNEEKNIEDVATLEGATSEVPFNVGTAIVLDETGEKLYFEDEEVQKASLLARRKKRLEPFDFRHSRM